MEDKVLKKRILAGERVFGAFFKMSDMNLVDMFAESGFDFLIADCEHGSFSHREVEQFVRTADAAGIASVIRVASPNEENILHAMDAGADGVQLPGLESVEEAEKALQYAKYYPLGKRGYSTAQRAARFGMWKKEQPYIEYANENSLTIAHVENVEMAKKIKELALISTLDVIFVGPGDLSQSMGLPGKPNSPEVDDLMAKVFEDALTQGKIVGSIAATPEKLEKLINMGARYLVYASDVVHIKKALIAAGQIISKVR